MKKYIVPITLSVFSASALAEGKWNAGFVTGWGVARISETLTQSNSFPLIGRYKFSARGNGPLAGVTAGYAVKQGKNIFGLDVRGYKDFFKATNAGPKNNTLSSIPLNCKSDIKRKYTLEAAVKAGRLINADAYLYAKAGVLRSEFQEQYGDSKLSLIRKSRGWGGVLGLGAQKELDSVTVGMEYNFQYYGRMGTRMNYVAPGTALQGQNVSKFRPKYHAILVSISKNF